jgi:anti-sigma regulatory factor (Ser/Thr protein kinase)
MTETATQLRHHVLVYESDDEYVERSVDFLREGLEAGEGAIVANMRSGLAKMRDALGPDAERVSFFDNGQTYTRPARALASYHGAFVEHLRDVPSVRAVADMPLVPSWDSWDEWTGYEALCNLSYAHLPVWVVCTYDANALPDPVLDSVLQTHSEELGDDCGPSEHYEDPRELLRNLTPEPQPLPDLRSFATGDDVEAFRERLSRELTREGVPELNALQMLVAGSEVAENAVRHGGGIAEVRTGSAGDRFVCEVVDRGPGFDDPATGYLAPREGTGSGLWVARQLAFLVESFRSPSGFTVRLWL